MARKVKKRKIKILPLLILIIVILGIVLVCKFLLDRPIKNIIVKNTTYIKDDYILELGGVIDYPSFLLTSGSKVEKKLKKSPYIGDVNVKRKFNRSLIIDVNEKKPIVYDIYSKNVVFDDNSSLGIDKCIYKFDIPRLNNYVPKKKYKRFIKALSKVNNNVLIKISDIEYSSTSLDDERFKLYMDDGNLVYITLTKFNKINYYDNIVVQLDGHKGVLYLDNGNHFEIKE